MTDTAKRPHGACWLAAMAPLLLLAAAPAFGHGDVMRIGSTQAGGGQLQIEPGFDFGLEVFLPATSSAGGMTRYSSIFPSFAWVLAAADGLHPLPASVVVRLTVVAPISEAAVRLDGRLLDTANETATIGSFDPDPESHVHPEWQLVLPDGVTGDYPIHFVLTTTAAGYTQSPVYTLVLTNVAPAPTATATASATAADTATATQTATATPTSPEIPSATPTPTIANGCAAAPRLSCRAAAQALLQLKDAADDDKDRLMFKWQKGEATGVAAFGDPRDATATTLCVYDGSGLKLEAVIPADPARWRLAGGAGAPKGYDYAAASSSSAGITLAKLRAGDAGKASLLLKGRGGGLALPAPADDGAYFAAAPIVAQMVNSEGECWLVGFSGPPQRNTGAAARRPQYKNQCKSNVTPCAP